MSNLFYKNKIFRNKESVKINRTRVDATHENVSSSEKSNASNSSKSSSIALSIHSYHTDKSMAFLLNPHIGQKKTRSDSVISDL